MFRTVLQALLDLDTVLRSQPNDGMRDQHTVLPACGLVRVLSGLDGSERRGCVEGSVASYPR